VYFGLAALFPVLALLANNVGQAPLADGLRAGALSILAAAVVFGIGWLILKDIHRAALLSLAFTLIVFSYGHLYQSLEGWSVGGALLGRHRFLLPLWLGLALAGGLWIVRSPEAARRLTPGLNLTAALLVSMPLAVLLIYQIRLGAVAADAAQSAPALPDGQSSPQALPDVYYIILDAYGSQAGLQEAFGYDNSEFVQALESRGFFIGEGSRSNYAQTELSLLSSLEMDYLQTLGHDQCGSCPRAPRIRNAAVLKAFDRLGYRLVALESGYPPTEWVDAELYLSRGTSSMSRAQLLGGISALEAMLIRTSIGLAVLDSLDVLPGVLAPLELGPLDDHRELVLFQLGQLARLPRLAGPKFVFAHIVAPHFPYVLGPGGEAVTPVPAPPGEAEDEGEALERESDGYIGELTYLNARVLDLVDQILQTSETPPVIILQGDHGPGVGSVPIRMKILNAYYLPGGAARGLYPTISPVNSFRVVLNELFGMGLPLLEDVSYYSTYPKPYTFDVVPAE
jgi:hypothetical protein